MARAYNDNCADATPISGPGEFSFDNSIATSDGPLESCIIRTSIGPPQQDVWFCWRATYDGPVTVHTCGETLVDTKMEIYDGCECPATPERRLACNDDGSDGTDGFRMPNCGLQSSVTIAATPGQSYLIRVGRAPYDGIAGGPGRMAVEYHAPAALPCYPTPVLISYTCQFGGQATAILVDSAKGKVVADDFFASSGGFNRICWWGTYGPGSVENAGGTDDAFEITYYQDEGGRPGSVLGGPYRQSNRSLTVTGPVPTTRSVGGKHMEFEYSATHAWVSLESVGASRYWVSIVNRSQSTTWAWEVARRIPHGPPNGPRHVVCPRAWRTVDGIRFVEPLDLDLAFCMPNLHDSYLDTTRQCTYPPPSNDACEGSLPLVGDYVPFDTMGATTNGTSEPECDFRMGDWQIHRDIWYSYVAPTTADLVLSLCETGFDTRVAVYEGDSCPPGLLLGCSDDGCGDGLLRQSELTVPVRQGQTYLIRVGSAADAMGAGTLSLGVCDPKPGELCPGECPVAGDFNCDHAIRHDDFAFVPQCLTGPCAEAPCAKPARGGCVSGDVDADGDVDLADVAYCFEMLDGSLPPPRPQRLRP